MDAIVEPYGRFWKVRVGERSYLEGIYTNIRVAEQAGKNNDDLKARKEAKRKLKNAKTKTKS